MRDRRPVVAAVLLAAGSGSRIGHRPKSLLELDGVPLIRRLLVALSGAGVDEVVVVLGHHADQIEPVVRDFPVTQVLNPHPDEGQVASQRLGLGALSGSPDAVIVALADQPLIRSDDIRELVDAFESRPAGTSFLFPQVVGQPGNPVIFSAEVRSQILADEAHVGGRQWRAAHPQAVAAYVTGNRHYCVDIDTEADRLAFERDTGQRLRWPA